MAKSIDLEKLEEAGAAATTLKLHLKLAEGLSGDAYRELRNKMFNCPLIENSTGIIRGCTGAVFIGKKDKNIPCFPQTCILVKSEGL